jgi:hypothetical protein
MINDYVIKLIDNLPDDIKNVKEPILIDLVLDGGIFNGSYLVGALYFLKEMEKRNYIKIDRISGCSIGAIVAFLYYIDALDLMHKFYEVVNADFRKTYKLTFLKELKKYLAGRIPEDILEKVNDRLFISYHNIKKSTKQVKSCYKDVDEIINTIIKSSFVPFLIDGNILYENKCIDGITPYIFCKEANKKILYLDLYGYDKVGNLLNVKNEKTNFHRILSGLLDIHSFFIKQSSTQMCSYVNDWNITNIGFNYCKLLIEKICVYCIYLLLFIKDKIPEEFQNTVFYKILSKIVQDIFIIILESYCL